MLTCGNPPAYFGLFWPSSVRSLTIKNTVMTIHVIDVQWQRENTNINLVKTIKKHSTMCIIIVFI